jgi:hypothetical protein
LAAAVVVLKLTGAARRLGASDHPLAGFRVGSSSMPSA